MRRVRQPGLGGKGGVGGIEHLTQCDISEHALIRGSARARKLRESARERRDSEDATGGVEVGTCHLMADEEFLPFGPGSFDLVLRFALRVGFPRESCRSLMCKTVSIKNLMHRCALSEITFTWSYCGSSGRQSRRRKELGHRDASSKLFGAQCAVLL